MHPTVDAGRDGHGKRAAADQLIVSISSRRCLSRTAAAMCSGTLYAGQRSAGLNGVIDSASNT